VQAFELRDVYTPHRPSSVARLELVSAQFTLCLIDTLEETLLGIPMGDRFAHFTVRGLAPSTANKWNIYRQSINYLPLGLGLPAD
jgi:hypothetical protein